MTKRTLLTVLLWPTIACSEIISPPDRPEPSLAAAGAAQSESGTAVLVGGEQTYVDCLGEIFAYAATIPYRYHLTVTPTGKTVLAWQFIPGSGTGTAVGLSSGRTWTLKKVVSPEVDHFGGDGGARYHWTANIWWESPTAPTVHTHTNFLLIEKDGALVVERAQLRCIAPKV